MHSGLIFNMLSFNLTIQLLEFIAGKSKCELYLHGGKITMTMSFHRDHLIHV